MSEETPQQLSINGIIATDRIIYTQSTVIIEHQVKAPVYTGLMIVAFVIFILSFLLSFLIRVPSYFFIGLLVAGIMAASVSTISAYRYEFDREKREIKSIRGGFLKITSGKVVTYRLGAMAYIRIHQIPTRYRNIFGIKLVVQNGSEIDLPAGYSLSKCQEYANLYKDLFGIRSPIWLP